MQGLGASVLINARGVYPKFYSNLREQYITRKLTKAANAVHGTEFTTWAEIFNLCKKQVRMYYGSGTGDRIASGLHMQRTLRVHTPDGSTFLREITPWPPS